MTFVCVVPTLSGTPPRFPLYMYCPLTPGKPRGQAGFDAEKIMPKPTIHLICNAHLDPVWQWRWEEGCGEALSTFGTAVRMLRQHKHLIFNHNEAVLYQWVEQNDPAMFRQIRKLVREGRWCIAGGWYLQPDLGEVRQRVAGLADWLSAPPATYAHLPIGTPSDNPALPSTAKGVSTFFGLTPSNVRLAACRRSHDRKALILRLQETAGHPCNALLILNIPNISLRLSIAAYEIKTLRVERNGKWREVHIVEEI